MSLTAGALRAVSLSLGTRRRSQLLTIGSTGDFEDPLVAKRANECHDMTWRFLKPHLMGVAATKQSNL